MSSTADLVSSVTSAAASTSASSSSNSNGENPPAGRIAGIVFGSIAIAAFLAGMLFMASKHRKRRRVEMGRIMEQLKACERGESPASAPTGAAAGVATAGRDEHVSEKRMEGEKAKGSSGATPADEKERELRVELPSLVSRSSTSPM